LDEFGMFKMWLSWLFAVQDVAVLAFVASINCGCLGFFSLGFSLNLRLNFTGLG